MTFYFVKVVLLSSHIAFISFFLFNEIVSLIYNLGRPTVSIFGSLSLLSDGITDVYHHAWLYKSF
jgi:hypothetical protein